MPARRQTARTSSNCTKVGGKLFFHKGMEGTKASMRVAAKRFVQTPEFDDRATYYEGRLTGGRWDGKGNLIGARWEFTAQLPISVTDQREKSV